MYEKCVALISYALEWRLELRGQSTHCVICSTSIRALDGAFCWLMRPTTFNSLNRKAAFRIVERQASLVKRLSLPVNTYKGSAARFSAILRSYCTARKGSQRDTLSMAFYALSVLPLILLLKDIHQWNQASHTDYAKCGGRLERLPVWYKWLMQDGPTFGFSPEPTKTYLVVDGVDLPEARRLSVWAFGCADHHLSSRPWKACRLNCKPS